MSVEKVKNVRICFRIINGTENDEHQVAEPAERYATFQYKYHEFHTIYLTAVCGNAKHAIEKNQFFLVSIKSVS